MHPELDERILARLPWLIHDKHRGSYHLMMLGCAVRDLDGRGLRSVDRHRLTSWRSGLRELNAVVQYDPKTPDGFSLVPRLEGDGDLTRPPMRGEGEIR
ncbi:hypothetical protein [Isoptericola sp. b408]|uniref:hypothetical protein n=1 Tax=Isoptericola sp. b408 TaxID=3064653 RepID=UPI0027123068|nr:hypothetical protein [Isoptericola sp. b408]MDO8150176.1 hypothetical protein [Isoptericola sp. b408]